MFEALQLKLEEKAFYRRENIFKEGIRFIEKPSSIVSKFKATFSLEDTIIRYQSYADLLKDGSEEWLIAEDFGGDWDSHPVQYTNDKVFNLVALAEGWSYDKDSKTLELKSMIFDDENMEWDVEIAMPPVCLTENIKDQILTWTEEDKEAIAETLDSRMHWFFYNWTKYFISCYQEKKILELLPEAPYWLKFDKEYDEEIVFKYFEDHYYAMMSLISDNQRRAYGKNKRNGDF